jgi:hypothetical protein
MKKIYNKFKNWLADKPKWIQWTLGTNIGHIVISSAIMIICSQLAEYVARDPFNTIAVVFFFITLAQIAFFTIVGVINSIKDIK